MEPQKMDHFVDLNNANTEIGVPGIGSGSTYYIGHGMSGKVGPGHDHPVQQLRSCEY